MGTTVQQLATEARAAFELKTRDDESRYWTFDHDTMPEWVQDMAYHAHDNGGMMPDDFRYAFIVQALELLAEADPEDYADADDLADLASEIEADIYTADLTRWLGSHAYRPGYVDDAIAELGKPDGGIIESIQLGQYWEKQEVFHAVLAYLANTIEDLEPEEDEDEGGE